jgi:hypothetical protein
MYSAKTPSLSWKRVAHQRICGETGCKDEKATPYIHEVVWNNRIHAQLLSSGMKSSFMGSGSFNIRADGKESRARDHLSVNPPNQDVRSGNHVFGLPSNPE